MSQLIAKSVDDAIAIVPAERADEFDIAWFDRAAWEAAGARRHTSTGRAPVLICDTPTQSWVLRHYSRGGLVARFINDHYVWHGLKSTRAWRELEILGEMQTWGLPAPPPVAALVQRSGFVYQADIITVFIPGTQAFSALLRAGSVSESLWRRIGTMLGRFHQHGVDHPDITAHNILVDADERSFLVDFDNAVLRSGRKWQSRGFARFQRSLRKVAMETGGDFRPAEWQIVADGYQSALRA